MSPDIRPNFNYSTSSHSELDQEVRRLRQNQRQDLLNQINTQLGKKAYDYYLPKIDLMYSLVTKEKYSLNDRNHIEQEYLNLFTKVRPYQELSDISK